MQIFRSQESAPRASTAHHRNLRNSFGWGGGRARRAERDVDAETQNLGGSSQGGQRGSRIGWVEHSVDHGPARSHFLRERALGDASALHCLPELQRERLLDGEELGLLAD